MPIRPYKDTHPQIAERVYIDDMASVIGDVVLADDVSIWPMCVVRGDVNAIRIGARSNIQDATVIHVTHDGPYTPDGGIPTIVGEDVTVGHKCLLHACTIGDRCLIGMGAIIMDGVVIGDDVIIGAGSLVTPGKQLESGWLYRGSPARPARKLTDQELEQLKYSAAHYVRLKDNYL
ncbi:gamma carbonic anhydrase family protein [Natronospira bacteriovora]|uniref:Gamma carbonic anhydrase family protein n=1 Tax=Natronospira bacteriovora TaxID=3069753 RepID=A0ABU0W6X5_9GAMM|nr:gamma carbonic anhydrase family protein [Natronospira sp. AB-CW4]MDQ2069707.1 gamma carbonic anhydrase family protein [Natronospira sp. AB-CW4]